MASTLKDISYNPSKPQSITSPFDTGPTPAGDPVSSKSPGSEVIYLETNDISCWVENIMSLVDSS